VVFDRKLGGEVKKIIDFFLYNWKKHKNYVI